MCPFSAEVSAQNINNTPPRPKRKPKTGLVLIRAACAEPEQRAAFNAAIKSGWTEAELTEYARLFFFRNRKDKASPPSYRKAVTQIALEESSTRIPRAALAWRTAFRKGGSQITPPRPANYLKRSSGSEPLPLDHPLHPVHTGDLVTLVEDRARAYHRIPPSQELHPNCWSASYRAFIREQDVMNKRHAI